MRICFIILIVIFVNVLQTAKLSGQQSPHFSQAIWQQALLNPAAVGVHPWLEVNGIIRAQWIGLEGAPITQGISADLPIPIFNAGFGFALTNDQLGAFRQTEIKLSGSYNLINKRQLLKIGAQFGVSQQSLNGADIVTPEGVYEESLSHEDDLLALESTNNINPNLGLGLYYKFKNWEAGFYAQGLLSANLALGAGNRNIAKESIVYNFYLNRSLELSRSLELRPSIWVMTDQINVQTIGGVLISYKNSLQGGFFLRGYNNKSLDALIAMLAYNVKNRLRVAYAYDFPLSGLSNVTQQTHELSLSYRISSLFLGKRSKIIYNPRFL